MDDYTITLAPKAAGQTIFPVGTPVELVGRVHEAGPSNPTPRARALLRGMKAEAGDLYTVRDPRTGRRADVYADEVNVHEGTPAVCGEHGAPIVSDGVGVMACPAGCEVTWPDLTPEPGTGVVIRDGLALIVPTDEDDDRSADALLTAATEADADDDAEALLWAATEAEDEGSIFDGTDPALLAACGPIATERAGLAADTICGCFSTVVARRAPCPCCGAAGGVQCQDPCPTGRPIA